MERRVAYALGGRREREATWTMAFAGRSIDTTVPSMPLQTGTSIGREPVGQRRLRGGQRLPRRSAPKAQDKQAAAGLKIALQT